MSTNMPGSLPEVSPLRFREAFEAVKEEMASLQKAELQKVNVDVTAAFKATRGSIPKLAPLRPLVAQLGLFNISNFDKLETYAYALMHAQAGLLAATDDADPIDEMNMQLTGIRESLLADAVALEKRKLLDARRSELKGAHGYRNLTLDVLTLSRLFRNNWEAIKNKTAVELAELDDAERLADRLISAVGVRDEGQSIVAEPAETRSRVFTLFLRAYDEVRRAVTFIRWHEGDVDLLVPNIFGGSRSRKSEVAAPDAQSTDPQGPAQTPAAPQAPAGNAPATPPNAGMPGTSPFTR